MAMGSCRKAFTSTLTQLAAHDKRLFAVATDSRGSVTIGGFAKAYPEQFVECGIAEQNAVGIACGLANTGKNVFVTGPAAFLAARSYEQVKVDVAYNAANVKIVGVSAGVSYGPLGSTHTTMHDYASMRALPGLTVLAPADEAQTAFLTRLLAETPGPFYMRMGRGDVEDLYAPDERFEIGKAKLLRDGRDVTLIACGEMVARAKAAAALLEQKGVSARVLDMFTIKPLDEDAVRAALSGTGAIVTVEEHSTFGGLGEAVAHVVAEAGGGRMRLLGLPEEVAIGRPGELFAHYGLTGEGIAAEAMKLLEV